MEQMPEMTPQITQGIGMVLGGIIIVMLVIFLIFSVFGCFCLANMARKLGKSFWGSFFMAFIPVINFVTLPILYTQMAKKPIWWFILCWIPLVNIVILVLLWMAIAENLGKPSWWGIMIVLVPVVNIVFFIMLTFAKPPQLTSTT
ncbi:MAG: hypothetical protein V1709_01675 [Planctomycetota bacterium]